MNTTAEIIKPTQADEKGAITVGVADIALSDDPNASIVTYALGSCIGVTIATILPVNIWELLKFDFRKVETALLGNTRMVLCTHSQHKTSLRQFSYRSRFQRRRSCLISACAPIASGTLGVTCPKSREEKTGHGVLAASSVTTHESASAIDPISVNRPNTTALTPFKRPLSSH